MTEDDIKRRRTYVAEIRNSFDTDEKEKTSYGEKEIQGSSFLFLKIQLLLAVLLFCLFLFWKLAGTDFWGYSTEDVVDMITDKHYDAKLQELLEVLP